MMLLRSFLPLALVLLVAACAPVVPAPVVDRTEVIPSAAERHAAAGAPVAAENGLREEAPARTEPLSGSEPPARPGHYIVRGEDTLYSIAFRHQLDWQALARWNGIQSPYTIQPGQDLRLYAPPGMQVAEAVRRQAAQAEASGTAQAEPPPGKAERAVATADQPDRPSTPDTAEAPTPDDAATDSAATRTVAGIRWQWPADGPVLSRYQADDPTRQGVDIGGHRGSPVRVAADGSVVYSGNGLVGYGELIIVKHSDTWLSAYGHNAKRLVKEGDKVSRGQEIATMGATGTRRVELHFEIRKHGQPIDPLGFLPKR